MAVIAIMAGIAVTALPGLMTAQGVTQATSNLSELLDSARSYAMAHQTYVFVGLEEVDGLQAGSVAPQVAGTGRLAVMVAASADGSNNYSGAGAWQPAVNLVVINKLTSFSGVHMSDFSSFAPGGTAGPMGSRVAVTASQSLGNSTTGSVTPLFTWPLSGGTTQYSFSKVIQFDPQGLASLQLGTGPTTSPGWMEIGLQATHGNIVPNPPATLAQGQLAAIQIDGITGANRVFRP